tara:strand:- start:238 stop:366 length:129 start_codon:yes stop_codon:yes gene_type:complete
MVPFSRGYFVSMEIELETRGEDAGECFCSGEFEGVFCGGSEL